MKLIVLIVLILAVCLFLILSGGDNDPTAAIAPTAANEQSNSIRADPEPTYLSGMYDYVASKIQHNTDNSYIVPLRYENEGFMMKIKVGDTSFDVILDSGSSSIVVSGSGCNRCPNGDKYPAPNKKTNMDIIYYGSQNNHVNWVKETVSILSNQGPIFKNINVAITEKIVPKDLDEHDGETEDVFNIFGISPVYGYHSNSSGFWEEQRGLVKSKWAVRASRDSPELYLGKWTERLNAIPVSQLYDITPMESLCNVIGNCPFPVKYPMIRGKIEISTDEHILIIEDAFVILDTGFTDCAIHPSLIKKIGNSWTMKSTFSNDVYTYTDDKHNIDPLDIHPRLVILGNRWMMQHDIGVDWDTRKIGIV